MQKKWSIIQMEQLKIDFEHKRYRTEASKQKPERMARYLNQNGLDLRQAYESRLEKVWTKK